MQTPEFLRVDDATVTPAPVPYERIGFSWGAVFAGVAIATALTIWFAEVGLALNLGIIDGNSDIGTVALVNGILWVVTGLIALFAGAWVAGRMAQARTSMEGGLHGVGVWAASAVLMLMLAFSAVGAVAGGMMKVIGSGLSSAGDAIAGVATDVMPSWDSVRETLENAQDEIAGPNATPGETVEALVAETRYLDESRLFQLAGEHFTLEGSQLSSDERAEFVGLISSRLGISQDVAQRTLTQWDRAWQGGVEQYEVARAEAIRIADETRDVATAAAGWAAFAMLLGLVASALGGAFGTVCRVRAARRDYVIEPSRPAPIAPGTTATEEAARRRAEEERMATASRTRAGALATPRDSTRQR